MGSYCDLKIGSIELGSFKNDYDPYLLSLFQESDKTISYTTIGEAGLADEYDDLEEDHPITEFHYSCAASVALMRLELMGYTKKVSEEGFYKGLSAQIERFEGYVLDWGPDLKEHLTNCIEVLRSLTVESWTVAFAEIQHNNYSPTMRHLEDYKLYPPLLQYMLTEDFFGFPGYSTLIYLRLVIDLYSEDEKLIYDFTSLANGGWVDEAEDLIAGLDEEVSATYSATRKFIIMTEGSSDTWIIQRSLKLLYPQIYDYFKFLDFESARIGGGAGMLANTVKAFASAGISNRIIALFDNDTAAKSAIKTLDNVDLPQNIQIKQYPLLDLAKNFPTIGPTGLSNTDINGLACSIELYLGEDILKDENSEFYPIHWRGYDVGSKQYQGEILNKTEIQNKFNAKLTACEKDGNLIGTYDWNGIRIIIETFFTTFHEQDAERILNSDDLF